MTSNREALLDKIRALLNKTQAAGCTEHEEMLALDKARAMMDAYEVTDEELKLTKEEKAVIKKTRDPHDKRGIRRRLAKEIAEFCDCKTWLDNDGYGTRYNNVTFAGLPSDVAFAEYLLDHLHNFVQSELADYLLDSPRGGRSQNRDFILGCTERIGKRLQQNVKKSKTIATSNSKALVVIKDQAIDALMEERGIKLRTSYSVPPNRGSGAYEAGQKAGDKATFGRPVGHGGTPQIGKRK